METRSSLSADRPVIFLIEDEQALLDAWVESLNQMGFEAFGFLTATAFYRAFAVARCHIVVIDVELPDENGFSIARHIRSVQSVGIVFATGRKKLEDRLEGLRSGGDAFLVKPVHTEELAYTLKAVYRRVKNSPNVDLMVPSPLVSTLTGPEKSERWSLEEGDWILRDPSGRALRLTSSERTMLSMLFAQRNAPVERNELALALGGGSKEFSSRRVDTLISRLRRKALDAGMPLPLHATRGMGYEFHS